MPSNIAPASFILDIQYASCSGIKSLYKADPFVVRVPAVLIISFAAYGMPWRGPLYTPFKISLSASFALFRASSSSIVMNALNL